MWPVRDNARGREEGRQPEAGGEERKPGAGRGGRGQQERLPGERPDALGARTTFRRDSGDGQRPASKATSRQTLGDSPGGKANKKARIRA